MAASVARACARGARVPWCAERIRTHLRCKLPGDVPHLAANVVLDGDGVGVVRVARLAHEEGKLSLVEQARVVLDADNPHLR